MTEQNMCKMVTDIIIYNISKHKNTAQKQSVETEMINKNSDSDNNFYNLGSRE